MEVMFLPSAFCLLPSAFCLLPSTSRRGALASEGSPQFSRPAFFLRLAPQAHPIAIGDQANDGGRGWITECVCHLAQTLGFTDAHGKFKSLLRQEIGRA